ncbi:MAG: hypothetical protein ABFQ65_01690 [Nanoarchaeota archaeon]
MSEKKKLSKLKKIALLGASFCLLGSNLFAEEREYKFNIYWSIFGGSWHLEKNDLTEENNNIYGIGISMGKNLDLFIKHADRNSNGHPSNFLGFNYRFFCTESSLDFCLGGSGGALDGYENVREDKGHFPVLAFYGGIRYKNFGIDLNIPPIQPLEFVWTWKTGIKF